jgi:hypothetical protein
MPSLEGMASLGKFFDILLPVALGLPSLKAMAALKTPNGQIDDMRIL